MVFAFLVLADLLVLVFRSQLSLAVSNVLDLLYPVYSTGTALTNLDWIDMGYTFPAGHPKF